MDDRRAVAMDHAKIARIVADCRDLEGPLLPTLHEIQAEFGHLPKAAIAILAEAFNLSRAEVHGVISFYHDFRSEPAGRHLIKLCRAEACQATGCEKLADDLMVRLGINWHGTTGDGAITLEPVFCLGLCATAPAAMIDSTLYGRLDTEALAEIVEDLRR